MAIYFPPTPAIILPHEVEWEWKGTNLAMAKAGLTKEIRRAVIVELSRLRERPWEEKKEALNGLAKWAGEATFPFPIFSPPTAIASIVYSFEGATVDNSNAATYTFTNKNIGAAGTGRLIVAGIGTSGGTPRTISGVTAGGNAMTSLVNSVGTTTGQGSISWFSLVIASGTTSTFVVSVQGGGSALNCTILIYRVFPVSGTAISTPSIVSGATTPVTVTPFSVKPTGLALIASQSAASITTSSWSGTNTPIHDLVNLTNDSAAPTNAWSIPTSETNASRGFTITNGTDVRACGLSYQ